MGNLEQGCSINGNDYGSFSSIVLARAPKFSKPTDRVLFQFFLVYMQRESVKRIIDSLIFGTSFYEICYRNFISCRCENSGKVSKKETGMEKFEFFPEESSFEHV